MTGLSRRTWFEPRTLAPRHKVQDRGEGSEVSRDSAQVSPPVIGGGTCCRTVRGKHWSTVRGAHCHLESGSTPLHWAGISDPPERRMGLGRNVPRERWLPQSERVLSNQGEA